MTVQRHERRDFYHLGVWCPFCGHSVVVPDAAVMDEDSERSQFTPCRHTLYVAHDEAFEFVSDRVETMLETLSYSVIRLNCDTIDVDSGEDDHSVDSLTDLLDFPDALKVARYVAAPGEYGSYVGFAPLEGE